MTEVYKAISAITGELATVGIAKGRKNTQQGYAFRGIDDIYGALSRLLANHELCVIPRVLSRSVTEREVVRQTGANGVLFYAVVDVEFDLVSAKDGSKHTARVCGEAMDSGDKATNKAMSAAYKYFALQTFCIPTEGDNDADAQTHEVAAKTPAQKAAETKSANEYSRRVLAALENGNDSAVSSIMQEAKTVSEEFAIAVWHTFPKSVQDKLRDISQRKAA